MKEIKAPSEATRDLREAVGSSITPEISFKYTLSKKLHIGIVRTGHDDTRSEIDAVWLCRLHYAGVAASLCIFTVGTTIQTYAIIFWTDVMSNSAFRLHVTVGIRRRGPKCPNRDLFGLRVLCFLSPCGTRQSIIEQTEDNSFYAHRVQHVGTREKLI